MTNLFDYVKKHGDKTFKEKEFNDIDNLVFCSLSYLNFSDTSINTTNHTLEYIAREYFSLNEFKDVKRLGIPQKNGYLLLQEVMNSRRYKNIIIHNYVYSVNKDKQFSAVMFRINRDLEYLCFEGTDELISGWKEDFELSYKFLIPSQKDAINYANKHIKLTGPNVIIGGHSKGGNLALVSAMYTHQYKKFRIKKVYNNDGPGLRLKEYNSAEYRRIKRKLINIIPEYSLVGILLNNDNYTVIKSSRKGIMAHAIASWVVEDDHLVTSTLSDGTKEFKENLNKWLDSHTDKEREMIVKSVFGALEKEKIENTVELFSITNLRKIINSVKNIDKHSKDLIFELISSNIDFDILNKHKD